MIPIIFSTDHNFIIPTGVAITSLLNNSKDENYDINIIIADNVSNEDKKLLQEVVASSKSKITLKDSGTLFDNAYEIRGITKASYFRLFIPWLFPEYDKVIYCDGDIIFRQGLSDLYQENIDEYYLGGVLDFNNADSYLRSIELDWNHYINAGVLLINCLSWRINNLNDVLIRHLAKKYHYQDQDIINIVCKNKIKYLSPIYNFNQKRYFPILSNREDSTERYHISPENLIKDIRVIHYCGNKPWNSMQQFLSADWYANYARSIFYNPHKEYQDYYDMVYPKINTRNLFVRFKRTIENIKYR